MKATTEKAFETYIEETMAAGGWLCGSKTSWDKDNALFREEVLAFIQDTQPGLWAQMEKLHGAELPGMMIEAFVKERATKGTMHVVRHGFKFYGKTFKLAFFKPAHGMNPEALALYDKNRLHVTRQVECNPSNHDTMDMVLSLNGLPLVTIELKNPATGQTWREAVAQYKTDRNPHAPLFQFKKGAVVHFAVDPEEVRMTTRLNGEKTFFLPFNRGSHPQQIQCGAGNPQHPSGHRTAYLWEEVFQKDSFMDIVGNFIFLDVKKEFYYDEGGKKKERTRETMVFPRYHQLDCVRRLIGSAGKGMSGKNYLIQHSAGSGKTNSISWLSHRLASLHTAADEKIFDCVVVITDRQVLDRQLQDAIYQIEHAQGVVKAIDEDSKQLAEALVDGTRIVITTLQKFPFVLNGLLHLAGAENTDKPDAESQRKASSFAEAIAKRRYAVIVDEAHSSQNGESARELKRILGAGPDEAGEGADDGDYAVEGVAQVIASRRQQKNISFFAFTATPKGKMLELFGGKGDDGKPCAFHTYSMKQAIEEGFILDVLKNYTTYKTYFQLVKKVEDDPEMPKKKAAKKLSKFLVLHPHNIAQKTEIIIEHFRRTVMPLLNKRAKAMVVTGSRLEAVRYKKAFDKYLSDNHYTDVRSLVAFSDTVKDKGVDYTEPGMNPDFMTGKPIAESQLPDKFDSPDYQVLLVANKYQTGFDQPLLCAMYVDKRLDGVQAVQTLSRLNRPFPGKPNPFVLDFVNKAEDIKTAFKPYYNVTVLDEPSDPTRLEMLKHELNETQVYLWSEVVSFCKVFYLPPEKQTAGDHAKMEKFVQPAVDRFYALDEETRESFHGKLTAYVSLYAFLSQIMAYPDEELELLYGYGRFLLPHIPTNRDAPPVHPEDDVELEYYRITKTSSGVIVLEDGKLVPVKSPTETGTGKGADEKKPLSEIIKVLNERLGTEFTDEDRLFFEQIQEKAIADERVRQTAQANTLDKFEIGIKKIIETLMIQRMSENDAIVSRYMDDADFQRVVFPILAKNIYRSITKPEPYPNAPFSSAVHE